MFRHADAKIAICVTCYDEDDALVTGTLKRIHDNVCNAVRFSARVPPERRLTHEDFVVRYRGRSCVH